MAGRSTSTTDYRRLVKMAQSAGQQFRQLPQRMQLWLVLILATVLVVASLIWLGQNNWSLRQALDSLNGGTAVSTGFAGSGVQTYSTASAVLDGLQVREASDKTGYDRTLFGSAWYDVDKNSCDTRNDILARDLTHISRDDRGCKVLSGTLLDPYTGDTVEFVRGESSSSAVPIDHVVALSNAWQTGATLLSETERTELANDPLNLQATGRLPNTEKSDKDAAAWLPQAGYRCEYVARQISVKVAYHLWVTEAEKQAMRDVLKSCPDQPAYRSSYALSN